MRLAAYHSGAATPMVPIRKKQVASGVHVYPMPAVVGDLVGLMMGCTRALFQECRSADDDLLVATFAAYLTTAIHPFEDANGRVAIGFAQHLLMKRWKSEKAPFDAPSNLHDVVGEAFAPLDRRNPGDTAEEFLESYKALLERISKATLTGLWKTGNLVAVAHMLAEACGRKFTARRG